MALCTVGFLGACAASRPDHFYILSVQPQGTNETRTAPIVQATLKVTLPSLVDRPEMVLNTSADGVTVLEHERWGAPLADLITQTLARDLERRRGDILVASGSTDHSGGAAVKIVVDVVQMAVHRGERASIETHWRIIDSRTGANTVGGETFGAPLASENSAAFAQALSECLGLLADRLVGQMH
jgi:uncharacterized lipoprotein YmbA